VILCGRILDFFNFSVMFKQAKNHIRLRPRVCRCFPNCDLDSSRDELLRIGLFELNQSGDCTLYGLQAPPFVPLSIVDWLSDYQHVLHNLSTFYQHSWHGSCIAGCYRSSGGCGSICPIDTAIASVYISKQRHLVYMGHHDFRSHIAVACVTHSA